MYVILYVLGFYASYIIPINEVKYRCYYQDRFSISADREQLVGVLPLRMLSVGLLYGENPRSVYLLHLDAPGAMHNPLLIYQDTHMRNRCIAHWGRRRLACGQGASLVCKCFVQS